MTKIKVVICSFYLSPEEIIKKMASIGRRIDVVFEGIIVNNKSKKVQAHQIKNWDIISGSNNNLDFSAYIEGITNLKKDPNDNSILFMNDSTFTKHHAETNIRLLINNFHFMNEVNRPAICGKLDQYKTICFSNPWSKISFYVSSYCFLLNKEAITILLQLDNFAQKDNVYELINMRNQSFSCALPINFKEFLLANTFYRKSTFSWNKNNSSDEELQNKKLRCIYFEHRLSGEIANKGILITSNIKRLDNIKLFIFELKPIMTLMRLFKF